MKKKTNYSFRTWVQWSVKILVLVTYFWVLEYIWGWDQLLNPWKSISFITIITAILVLASTYFIRALRIYDYFRKDINGNYLLTLRLTLLHNLLNNMLPARTGEISFPVLMSRYFQVSLTRATASLLWFRFVDLHTVIFLGAAALYFTTSQSTWWIYGLLIWLPLPIVIYLAHTQLNSFILKVQNPKWQNILTKLVNGLPNTFGELARAWLWTIFNWGVKISALAWILILFTPISMSEAWVGSISGDLSSILPLHAPAGIGTYEAAVLGGLATLGVETDSAIQAAVNLHIMILLSSLIGGGLALFIPYKNQTKAQQQIDY